MLRQGRIMKVASTEFWGGRTEIGQGTIPPSVAGQHTPPTCDERRKVVHQHSGRDA